jgi:hypothetical protein
LALLLIFSQKPRAKGQRPRAKGQEPKAKSDSSLASSEKLAASSFLIGVAFDFQPKAKGDFS